MITRAEGGPSVPALSQNLADHVSSSPGRPRGHLLALSFPGLSAAAIFPPRGLVRTRRLQLPRLSSQTCTMYVCGAASLRLARRPLGLTFGGSPSSWVARCHRRFASHFRAEFYKRASQKVPKKRPLLRGHPLWSTDGKKEMMKRALKDLLSSPSNALNWLRDLPEPQFSLLWHEGSRSVTCKVFPGTVLLWEWSHWSQPAVCFTTVAKRRPCNSSLPIFWFLKNLLASHGADIAGLSHNAVVSCHLFSGDSTLCGYRLRAHHQDDVFCLRWLFLWFLGKKCRCFSIILREFWLTPWVEFSVPPAMEKRVLLNRKYRIELLIFVFFLVAIVFQAKAF